MLVVQVSSLGHCRLTLSELHFHCFDVVKTRGPLLVCLTGIYANDSTTTMQNGTNKPDRNAHVYPPTDALQRGVDVLHAHHDGEPRPGAEGADAKADGDAADHDAGSDEGARVDVRRGGGIRRCRCRCCCRRWRRRFRLGYGYGVAREEKTKGEAKLGD